MIMVVENLTRTGHSAEHCARSKVRGVRRSADISHLSVTSTLIHIKNTFASMDGAHGKQGAVAEKPARDGCFLAYRVDSHYSCRPFSNRHFDVKHFGNGCFGVSMSTECQIASKRDPFSRATMTPLRRARSAWE